MDLSTLLTTITLAILGYAGVKWVNSAYLAPRRAAKPAPAAAESVKSKPRLKTFRGRSRVQNVQNAVNVGSGQQEAKEPTVNVPNVQPVATEETVPSAAIVSSSEGFTLTTRELIQLAESLRLYQEGANVEQAVCGGFGVTKGGSEGWKRAKAIFDAATVPPGAAPAGTYAAPAAAPRRRRAAR